MTPAPPVYVQNALRVYVQNVPVCTGTTHTCFNMCARGAGTHGDVLNVHTGTCGVDTRVFQRVTHHTPHTTHHTTHNNTTHNNTTHNNTRHNTPQQHDHNTSRKQRQRERQRKKTETEKEKRREKIHFQCGGAWLFFVDSSFISFSASWPVNSFFIICELIFPCTNSFHIYIYIYIYIFFFLIMQLCEESYSIIPD